MEKGKKGLFRRLLTFWKGEKRESMSEGIDFWKEPAEETKNFAELGAVAALSQQEMKKTFWEETAEQKQKAVFSEEAKEWKRSFMQDGGVVLGEKKKSLTETGVAEEQEKRTAEQLLYGEKTEKRTEDAGPFMEKKKLERIEGESRTWFSAEVFEAENGVKRKTVFSAEMPEEKRERRQIIPVAEAAGERGFSAEREEPVEKQKPVQTETMQESGGQKTAPAESKQAESVIDIEKLMEQMTKRLWEERESSGRRLR